MPKVFSKEEKDMVKNLALENRGHVEIAKIMSEKFPSSWNSKNAHRSVARILKGKDDDAEDDKTLDEMTRDERVNYIESRLQLTPRFRITFASFGEQEKAVFVDEYLKIMKSTETLTEAEEQSLFAATLEFVLSLQSLSRKEREERFFERSQNGEIQEGEPTWRGFVNERYHKEYDTHTKNYQKIMEGLKMSRSQRLKEVRSQKQTLIDIAEELSSKNAQAEVAEEIERLSKCKDDELKRMIEDGHLYGRFEDFQ